MIGSTLGPYQVLSKLGEGGMGEVYRARDTKLNRDVALKLLPEAFAADDDRLARFEREAQALAALNHPNIAAVYGLEGDGSSALSGETRSRAIVMELVEGEDLSERIARGAMPLDEALPIARQIAGALEAAHEAGIVHRDLKPANIKLRPDGTVKVLDFGLAKALAGPDSGASSSASALANSPTLTARATELGVILGTAAYMAPEQAKGRAVDRRADVWAFGVVLYEMLTGRRAFSGDDVTEVMAAVIRDTPDLGALPAGTPASVRRLLRRALDKDPRKRLRDMGDAGVELDEAMTGSGSESAPAVQAEGRRGSPVMLAGGAVVLAAMTGLAAWSLKPEPVVEKPITRFAITLPEDQQLQSYTAPNLAVSPDGRHIAYRAQGRVILRNLDELEPRDLVEEQGSGVWFSPDSSTVLFGTLAGLSKVPVTGGPTQQVAAATQVFGADWGADGTIVFADASAIMRVPAVGGVAEAVVSADRNGSNSGFGVAWPQLLPDGKSLLYTFFDASGVAAVVQPLAGGDRKVVLPGVGAARYIATGHLVHGLENRLVAVPFDLSRLEVVGPPVPMPETVYVSGQTYWAQASIAENGTLVHFPRYDVEENLQLAWVNEDGDTSVALRMPRLYSDVMLSPDGRRAALHLWDEENDVWVADLVRGGLTRITFTPGEEETPVWSPDGRELAYAASRESAKRSLFVRPADGSAAAVEREVWSAAEHFHANDWSPDGSTLIVEIRRQATAADLVAIDVQTGTATELLGSAFNEFQARLSPDGRWLAYVSDESGRKDVYVQPYPSLDSRVLVSIDGGVEPVWSADGRRLFFRSGTVMAANVTSTSPLEFGVPEPLFPDRFARTQGDAHTHYDVGPDGRLLMVDNLSNQGTARRQEIQVVLNWADELKRLAPADR